MDSKFDMNQIPPMNRIGSVSYLNARPLIWGIENDISFGVPAQLAQNLSHNKLDAALIPVADYFEHPQYQIVPEIAIGCRGLVKSVYLVHRKPLFQLKKIALDPASKTSNLLLKISFAEFFHHTPIYSLENTDDCDGYLLIGDSALIKRDDLLKKKFLLLDLGGLWYEKTGLPFVFAFWAINKNQKIEFFVKCLTQSKQEGLCNLESIIASQNVVSSILAEEYLKKCIRYDLGAEEIRGFLEFQRLCLQHGLIAKENPLNLARP